MKISNRRVLRTSSAYRAKMLARFLRTVIVAIFLFESPNFIYAQIPESRAGNVVFKMPEGWKRIDQDGAVFLLPGGMSSDQLSCAIMISPGEELHGDFRAWFDAAVERTHRGATVIGGGELTTTRAEEGYDVLCRADVTADANGEQLYRFYLAAHPGARVEFFVYAATSSEDYQRHQPALDAFIKSVDFVNRREPLPSSPAPPPMSNPPAAKESNSRTVPSSPSAGLDGLFTGTETRNQLNFMTNMYEYRVIHKYYIFSPEGWVYYGLPKGGAASNFDFSRAQREDAKNCGSYRIVGNQIEFIWSGNASNQTLAFSRNGNGIIQLGKTAYYRIEKMNDLRLNGTYGASSFVNTSTSTNTSTGTVSGVSSDRSIAFGQDGRFSAQGFVGFSGAGQYAGGYASSQTASSGTYRIYDYTLELNYSDGRNELFTLFVHPQNAKEAKPGLVMFEGAGWLLRQ